MLVLNQQNTTALHANKVKKNFETERKRFGRLSKGQIVTALKKNDQKLWQIRSKYPFEALDKNIIVKRVPDHRNL